MSRPISPLTVEILALAERYGISVKSVRVLQLYRPMTEDARQVLVNQIKKTHAPHSDPMLIRRAFVRGLGSAELVGMAITETEDAISITVPKRPAETTREEIETRKRRAS